MKATARMLTGWSSKTVGNVRLKLAISRELLLRLDAAQDHRALSPHEDWLRRQIKASYLGLASLERTIARQRARLATLKDGDANTSVFHRQCTYRRQKNRIHSLPAEMVAAAYAHFDALLGTEAPGTARSTSRTSSPPPIWRTWMPRSTPRRSGRRSKGSPRAKPQAPTASQLNSYAHAGPPFGKTSSTSSVSSARCKATASAASTRRFSPCCPSAPTPTPSATSGPLA